MAEASDSTMAIFMLGDVLLLIKSIRVAINFGSVVCPVE